MHSTAEVAHNELVLTVRAMWSYLPCNPVFRGDSDTGQAIIVTEVACIPTTVDAGAAEGLLITDAMDFERDPRHCRPGWIPCDSYS